MQYVHYKNLTLGKYTVLKRNSSTLLQSCAVDQDKQSPSLQTGAVWAGSFEVFLFFAKKKCPDVFALVLIFCFQWKTLENVCLQGSRISY